MTKMNSRGRRLAGRLGGAEGAAAGQTHILKLENALYLIETNKENEMN